RLVARPVGRGGDRRPLCGRRPAPPPPDRPARLARGGRRPRVSAPDGAAHHDARQELAVQAPHAPHREGLAAHGRDRLSLSTRLGVLGACPRPGRGGRSTSSAPRSATCTISLPGPSRLSPRAISSPARTRADRASSYLGPLSTL